MCAGRPIGGISIYSLSAQFVNTALRVSLFIIGGLIKKPNKKNQEIGRLISPLWLVSKLEEKIEVANNAAAKGLECIHANFEEPLAEERRAKLKMPSTHWLVEMSR